MDSSNEIGPKEVSDHSIQYTKNESPGKKAKQIMKIFLKIQKHLLEKIEKKDEKAIRYVKKFFRFLGISKSFREIPVDRLMEVKFLKNSIGRKNDNLAIKLCKLSFNRWLKRWLVITEFGVSYYHSFESSLCEVRDSIFFDRETKIFLTRVSKWNAVYIRIENSHRRLKFKIKDYHLGLFTFDKLIDLINMSPYTKTYQFDSFAPIRINNGCEFFIDGEGYFEKVHDAISNAKSEILICGWFISPELPLLRPKNGSMSEEQASKIVEDSMLKNVLKRVADTGVKVYILVYKEFWLSMYNDSEHVKITLEKLSENIKVI